MNSPTPLVSVLIPAFNAEPFLAEAMHSALASSFRDLEVVVVDDGSTDGTACVAHAIAAADARVRLFRCDHQGVSFALNLGLAQCRGEFVARLDADDLWHPSKIGKQLALFQAAPGCALVSTFVRYVDERGRLLCDADLRPFEGPALCRSLYHGIIGGGSSVMIRRSVIEKAGGFDEDLRIWEDLAMHVRVAALGSIGWVPEFLAGYRLRSNSGSSDRRRALADWRKASRRLAAEFPHIPRSVIRWSNARRLLEIAEWSIHEGDLGTGARLLSECLRLDPARTGAVLGEWIGRRLGGRRAPAGQTGPHFSQLDPASPSHTSAGEQGRRLRAFNDARERRLEVMDRSLNP